MDEVELRSVICHLVVMAMEVEDPQMLYDEVENPPVVYTPRTSPLAERFADAFFAVQDAEFWEVEGLAGDWSMDEIVPLYREHHGLGDWRDAFDKLEAPTPANAMTVMATAVTMILKLANPDYPGLYHLGLKDE